MRALRLQAILLAFGLALFCWGCSGGGGPTTAEAPKSPLNQAKAPSNIWKSETTGKEYRVSVTNDRLSAEWVNVPPAAAQRGAYIRSECHHVGDKWVGTSDIFMPCTLGNGKDEHIANMCHLNMKVEFDSVSRDRITGRGQSLRKFDCKSCKAIETGWGDFVWVPAQ